MAEGKKKRRRRRRSKGRVLAIVLSTLAILFALTALAAFGFLRYTNKMRAGMFADRSSTAMQTIRQQKETVVTPAPEPAKSAEKSREELLREADWIDEDGSAYRYRDDVQAILVMGIDYMSNEAYWDSDMVSNGGNADVLALFILESETNRLSILYIPRDTMTDMLMLDAEGNYIDTVTNNISASHSYGDGGELSCELTADAVSNLLCGIPVTRFAAMDYDSITAVNQALGGLEITFPDDYSWLDYSFRKGETVRLSDYQLNWLIRYRDHSEMDGAYQRGMRDLKLVLKAMFRQLKTLVKNDPTAALSIYRQLEPYMTTNLSADEVSYLAQQVTKFSFDDQTIIQMPGVVTHGEKYVEFYPDAEWLHEFVISTFCEKLN